MPLATVPLLLLPEQRQQFRRIISLADAQMLTPAQFVLFAGYLFESLGYTIEHVEGSREVDLLLRRESLRILIICIPYVNPLGSPQARRASDLVWKYAADAAVVLTPAMDVAAADRWLLEHRNRVQLLHGKLLSQLIARVNGVRAVPVEAPKSPEQPGCLSLGSCLATAATVATVFTLLMLYSILMTFWNGPRRAARPTRKPGIIATSSPAPAITEQAFGQTQGGIGGGAVPLAQVTTAPTATPPKAILQIGRRTTEIMIDGDDGDWQSVPQYPAGNTNFRLASVADDLDAQWRVQWDDQALYLLASVDDDIHVPSLADGRLHLGDSIELWVAPTGVDGQTAIVALAPADDAVYSYRYLWQDNGYGPAQPLIGDSVLAVEMTNLAAGDLPLRYVIEARLDWKNWGWAMPPAEMRLTFNASDNDSLTFNRQEMLCSSTLYATFDQPTSWQPALISESHGQ